MPKPTVFLDLDDVLVDFTGGACRVWGVDRADFDAAQSQTPGGWSIVEPLGRVLGRPLNDEEFWAYIHRWHGEAFWMGLQVLPWARELTQRLHGWDVPWFIVSSPSDHWSSYSGKVKWLKRYFGQAFDRFILTRHKHLLARPGTLLIDDRESNVAEFCQEGGSGLVFPTRGNNLYNHASDPLSYLLPLLKERLDYAPKMYQRQ